MISMINTMNNYLIKNKVTICKTIIDHWSTNCIKENCNYIKGQKDAYCIMSTNIFFQIGKKCKLANHISQWNLFFQGMCLVKLIINNLLGFCLFSPSPGMQLISSKKSSEVELDMVFSQSKTLKNKKLWITIYLR